MIEPCKRIVFVKFGCGCIGLPADEDGRAIILKPCDEEQEEGMFCRTINEENRPSMPVSAERQAQIVERINRLCNEGRNMRDVRALLTPTWSGGGQ